MQLGSILQSENGMVTPSSFYSLWVNEYVLLNVASNIKMYT